jgi:hypothetical protein
LHTRPLFLCQDGRAPFVYDNTKINQTILLTV